MLSDDKAINWIEFWIELVENDDLFFNTLQKMM